MQVTVLTASEKRQAAKEHQAADCRPIHTSRAPDHAGAVSRHGAVEDVNGCMTASAAQPSISDAEPRWDARKGAHPKLLKLSPHDRSPRPPAKLRGQIGINVLNLQKFNRVE